MLDAVLGNSKNIESVGEMISGLSRFEKEICSCGVKLTECNFWRKVIEDYNKSGSQFPMAVFGKEAIKQANVKRFFPTFLNLLKHDHLVESNVAVFKAISAAASKPVVVDSNKEPSRALFLLMNYKDALVVHLVRRPERVVSSSYFRVEKGDKIQFLRWRFRPRGIVRPLILFAIAASWSVSNFLAEFIKLMYVKRVITIRYEDFIDHPEAEVKRIERLIRVPLDDLVSKLENNAVLKVGHNIGGNQFRFEKEFQIRKNGIRRAMPKYLAFFTIVVNFPMMLYYRYNPFANR